MHAKADHYRRKGYRMKPNKKIITGLIICCFALCGASSIKTKAKDYSKKKYDTTRWNTIKEDYLNTKTDRLIFVKYKDEHNATVEMWEKVQTSSEDTATNESTEQLLNTNDEYRYKWKKILSCKSYVGQNGIGKEKQGDRKTPVGIYNITMAFGRKKSPGTAGISYTKLNKYHYWSTEKETYNTFVDVRTLGRKQMDGEHLINYDPWYNYSLAIDYNKKCTYLKGSAIFLHCVGGGRTYTMGCIAISEKNMKTIVKDTTKHTKICIYKE